MTIAELAAKYEQYVIDMRREFHENPELSHHEERTVRRSGRSWTSWAFPTSPWATTM